ncbi:glucuronyl esterase domain-containing protein [Granulicella paludicola]|uniref:glucuronyl esterase domain-containing protein n=1 Tax=Granulicella paludicola TaxID=474951 RepID=UPI0021E0B0EB|nr:acetylxylan esterase [Granulicella paludicola]
MCLRSALSLALFGVSVFGLHAQQTAPAKEPPPVVAGIPLNYDEAKVGIFTLPDAMRLNDGRFVTDAKTWTQRRRPEIIQIFETQQFGRVPTGAPTHLTASNFEITDKGTPALHGAAIRRQITIHLTSDSNGPAIHLLEYLPTAAKKPVPLLLAINFGANQNAIDDPGITPQMVWDPKTHTKAQQLAQSITTDEQGKKVERRAFVVGVDAAALLAANIGVATFYYGDVVPDYPEGFNDGIQSRYLKTGQTKPAPDEWGTIAAWAWGMSRVEDYLETDPRVDARRVAIQGVSRLGKTVMWAGAHDQRFALVIASCSGEGGAALSHRNYGETIAHLTDPTRYSYQFATNWSKYGGFPDIAPMDAHMLIDLIAPRPLLLQTGNTDYWSDPKGEFLAEVAAAPVYKLLGKDPLDTETWPAAKQPILHDLGYYMHDGGHGMVPSDWAIYVDFLKLHLHPEP